ncbi:MAG: hypothetical protein H7235_02295 [Bdellovibrionaceae bacterium]|nr:hypothetical protein [Pseudobdellovibrionaceae bacterium]
MLYKFTLLLFCIHASFCAFAENQKAVLITPTGRFQESNPPIFFKWSLHDADITSITLKVFRRKLDGTYNKLTNLVARFDLPRGVTTLPWSHQSLSEGKYLWTIEGYNETNSPPLFYESAEFVVEKTNFMDLRTRGLGLILGFSRGQYTGSDPFYSAEFKTTPTIYGLLYRAGAEDRLWDFLALITDFTVRGSVRQNLELSGSYSFRTNTPDAKQFDVFVGPLLQARTYARILTPDGVTLVSRNITQLSPGVALTVQKRLGLETSIYTKAQLSTPIYSTVPMPSSLLKYFGYDISGGIVFGQFWPLSFGVELQYGNKKSATTTGPDTAIIANEGWSFAPNLVYTF